MKRSGHGGVEKIAVPFYFDYRSAGGRSGRREPDPRVFASENANRIEVIALIGVIN